MILNIDTNLMSNDPIYNWEFYIVDSFTISLVDLLIKLNWATSKTKARKLIEQGAITSGEWPYNKITDPNHKFVRKGLDNYIHVEYRTQYKSECIQLKHNKHTLLYYTFWQVYDKIRSKYWILKDKVQCYLPVSLRF